MGEWSWNNLLESKLLQCFNEFERSSPFPKPPIQMRAPNVRNRTAWKLDWPLLAGHQPRPAVAGRGRVWATSAAPSGARPATHVHKRRAPLRKCESAASRETRAPPTHIFNASRVRANARRAHSTLRPGHTAAQVKALTLAAPKACLFIPRFFRPDFFVP